MSVPATRQRTAQEPATRQRTSQEPSRSGDAPIQSANRNTAPPTQPVPGTGQSRRHTGQPGDNKPTSLWAKLRNNVTDKPTLMTAAGRTGTRTAGSGVERSTRANELWDKFLTDQNLLPADKAATRQASRNKTTQRTRRTGDPESYTRQTARTKTHGNTQGSQGSKRPSAIEEENEEEGEEEEEEDEENEMDSEYGYYLPAGSEEPRTPLPRMELEDSYEACTCFPKRSNKFISSMLYDQITCKHTGLTGHTQPGVFKFQPYWNENFEIPRKVRKRNRMPPKIKFVMGYPRPKFVELSDDEGSGEDGEDDEEEEEEDEEDEQETVKDEEEPDDEEDENSEDYESEGGDDETDSQYFPIELPQIGLPYTPSEPRSRESYRSVYSAYSSVPESLPSIIPRSVPRTGVTGQTNRSGQARTSQTRHRTAGTSQTRTQTARKTAGSTRAKSRDPGPSRRDPTATAKSKTSKVSQSLYDAEEQEDESQYSGSPRESRGSRSMRGLKLQISERKFQGRFYDPVTKQVMLYDIGPGMGGRLPPGVMEPLNKPSSQQSSVKGQPTTAAPASRQTQSRTSKQSQKDDVAAGIAALIDKKEQEDAEEVDDDEDITSSIGSRVMSRDSATRTLNTKQSNRTGTKTATIGGGGGGGLLALIRKNKHKLT